MILASQSPRRLELIESLGITPQVIPADIDESRKPNETPLALVKRLAQEKAIAVCRHLMNDSRAAEKNNEIVVGADTIVWTADGTVFGKPQGSDDAKRMLQELSGKTHFVSTGVALRRLKAFASPSPQGAPSVIAVAFVQTTEVTFFELSNDEIAAYIASGESSDKAGAYGIQGRGRFLVQEVKGDYENVVGLPVSLLARELVKFTGDHSYLKCPLEGKSH